MWKTYQTGSSHYIQNETSNLKSIEISELKSRLFDLEQAERDNNFLSQKLEQLKKDYSNLNDNKNKLEQEIDEKEKENNNNINDLCNKNEDLRTNYNDKLALNKKVFKENDELEKEIEAKDDEINKLKKKFKKLKNQLENTLFHFSIFIRFLNFLLNSENNEF